MLLNVGCQIFSITSFSSYHEIFMVVDSIDPWSICLRIVQQGLVRCCFIRCYYFHFDDYDLSSVKFCRYQFDIISISHEMTSIHSIHAITLLYSYIAFTCCDLSTHRLIEIFRSIRTRKHRTTFDGQPVYKTSKTRFTVSETMKGVA